MSAIITKEFQGHLYTFRQDGYFNMTKAAKQFGKDLSNFMRSPDTGAYIKALSVNITDKELIQVQRGSGLLPQVGTYGHPKLAVFFARWLSAEFAVWFSRVSMLSDTVHISLYIMHFIPHVGAVYNPLS
jgi:hypothetical protein